MEQTSSFEAKPSSGFKALVALSCLFGAASSLFFAIFSFMNKSIYYGPGYGTAFYYATPMDITYGILLIAFALSFSVIFLLSSLLSWKMRQRFCQLSVYIAVMPLYLIEGLSLISMDYGHLYDSYVVTSFVFALLVVACGGAGMGLAARGKKIPARILLGIFLAVVAAGSILGFASSTRYGSMSAPMLVIGNIMRLLSVIFAIIVVFSKAPYGHMAVTAASSAPSTKAVKPASVDPASEARFKKLVIAATICGALAALFLAVNCFTPIKAYQYNYYYYGDYDLHAYQIGPSPLDILYGVLLLLVCVAGSIVLLGLGLKKWPEKFQSTGISIAIMPLYSIEALSLISINYGHLYNIQVLLTFIFALLIVACGGLGSYFASKGKRIPARILLMVFLAFLLAGSIMIFITAGQYRDYPDKMSLIIIGNVFRVIAIGFTIPIVFSRYPFAFAGAAPQTPRTNKAVYYAQMQEEAVKPQPTLREKLTEAKKLFEDGLIDEEEYKGLKKRYLDSEH